MKDIATGKPDDNLELSTCTALLQNDKNGDEAITEKSKSSPLVSRYGRAHKPKISEDFLPTDKKVGAILGLSPKLRSSLPRDASRSYNSPNKAVEKGRMIFELLSGEKQLSTRGRKPKLKLAKAVPSEKEKSVDTIKIQDAKSLSDKSEVSISENLKEVIKKERNVEDNGVSINGELSDNVIMSPDVTSSVDDNVLSENIEQLPSTSKFVDCGWVPGDLAWARVGGHPFWPCMVAMDPLTGVFTKVKRVGRGLSAVQRSLHVQFFGDNGRHSWVSTSCVIKFEGKDGLQNFAEKVLLEIKKKDKKFSSAFTIRPSSKAQWEYAVQEAEEVLPKTNQERIQFFEDHFPPESNLEEFSITDDLNLIDGEVMKQDRSLKRKKNNIETDDKPIKQIKIDPERNCEKRMEEGDTSLNGVVRISNRNKFKQKINVKKESSGFDVFADKYLKHASEIHPGMNEESLQKFMVTMWKAMDVNEKAIYKREKRDSSEESSAEEEASDNDHGKDNDNSSNSTRESIPSLALTHTLLKKASGLFRGTRLEKVCQICLKPGNILKCKGLCLRSFHTDCVKCPPQKQETSEIEAKKRRGRLPKSSKSENPLIDNEEKNTTDDLSCESISGMDKENDKNDTSMNDSGESKTSKFDEELDSGEFRCKDCSENNIPACFVCSSEKDPKSNSDTRIRCINGHCGKFYHVECVKAWPQASFIESSKKQMLVSKNIPALEGLKNQVLTCPQHVCHTCTSDDPRNATIRFNHERLVRCVLCPTAYHTGNYCVPAGSEILTGTQIICPRHYEPPIKGSHHVNAAWCFICAMGGSLICCDLCPTSFHADCLRIAPPEGGYICEDCDTGRYPLYGEVVWVKLGAYRWWPAEILFPNQIPDNVANLPHKRGEFAVRFFGSHDHYWVNRGRVFLYQEGDTGHKSVKKTSVDSLFQKALAEAANAHKKMKIDRSLREAEVRPGMKPPTYTRIKTNKPVGNVRMYEADPSSLTPCECDPDSRNPCSVDSDCLNRILMVECNPSVCAAGDKCGNQLFLKRQYPPLEPFKTESRGWGLRALKSLHKGEFIIEYVGEMIDETEYRRRLDCKHRDKDENYYFLTIDNHRLLDAGPKGNVARFMNHCCQPNCETQKWTVNGDTRVGLFALKDIPKGEELTFNYNLECVGPDKKPCMCGAPNCSGFIGVKVSKLVDEDKKNKHGKLDNQRIGRRKKKRHFTKLTEGECFECGGGGELLLCDNKTCPKGFHLSCAKRNTWPKGKWLCPWHLCDICQRRTGKRCGFCPRSYCVLHAEGNIRLHSSLGMVCRKHDEETDKTLSAYNEILEDVEICLKGIQEKDDIDKMNTLKEDIVIPKQDNIEQFVQAEEFSDIKKESHSEDYELKGVDCKPSMISTNNLNVSQVSLTQASSSKQIVNNLVPKKRGRPRKYPLSPPTLARYVTPTFNITNKQKTKVASKSLDGSTIKKKLGRRKKIILPNNLEQNSGSQMNQLDTQHRNIVKDVIDEHSQCFQDSPTVESNEHISNKVSPRTSKRKRQPSEKLAAFICGQSKSATKRMNKCLEAYINKIERRTNSEIFKNKTPPPKISKIESFQIQARKLSSPKKIEHKHKLISKKLDYYFSQSHKNSLKSKDSASGKLELLKSAKSLKVDSKATNKSVTNPERNHQTKVGKLKVSSGKLIKNNKPNEENSVTTNVNKNSLNKTDKDDLFYKSYLRRKPKKTILQRVDHKPDISMYSLQCNQKTEVVASYSSTQNLNAQGSSMSCPTKNNIGAKMKSQNPFEKSEVNRIDVLSTESGILEPFDDGESQFFGENIKTIPIKCSEFDQRKDEFLRKSSPSTEELVGADSNMEPEFTSLCNEETTEKLSEDGKYQILTNMRPDSLEMEKQSTVLMSVES